MHIVQPSRSALATCGPTPVRPVRIRARGAGRLLAAALLLGLFGCQSARDQGGVTETHPVVVIRPHPPAPVGNFSYEVTEQQALLTFLGFDPPESGQAWHVYAKPTPTGKWTHIGELDSVHHNTVVVDFGEREHIVRVGAGQGLGVRMGDRKRPLPASGADYFYQRGRKDEGILVTLWYVPHQIELRLIRKP